MAFKIDPETYYDSQEYACIAGKKPSTVIKDRSLGNGPPFVKIGKNVFYKGGDILAYLDKQRAHHGAEHRAKQQARA